LIGTAQAADAHDSSLDCGRISVPILGRRNPGNEGPGFFEVRPDDAQIIRNSFFINKLHRY